VVDEICTGTALSAGEYLDLTCSDVDPIQLKDGFAVVGMPVYAGRLPALAVERFASVRGVDTPVVAVVVYGNRAYDDALLELCDLCSAQGFRVVGAAAFIGEHSFSMDEFPIAVARPDQSDLQKAEALGRSLVGQNKTLDLNTVPGKRPYKDPMIPVGAAAESNPETCLHCGMCVAACPAGAIRMEDALPKTNAELCIWCAACARACTAGARAVTLPKIQEIAARLHQNCQERREPEWFTAGFIINPRETTMKIAIPTANGKLCMHFGHCEVFTLLDVDLENRTVLSVQELDPPPHEPGVLPHWLAGQGADLIIAGGMGMRAQNLFEEQNIKVVVGASAGNPKELAEAYMAGTLTTGSNACDH
jgi:predicted Fe-Mo cluster-binding NifX family protein/Fe-S-cluster-containing hydrogenase component 2